jgi:DNA-binding PucR family transcriptional regulator
VAAVRDELRVDQRALVGVIGEDIVVIIRPETAAAVAARIRDRLRATASELRVSIGISDPRPDVGDLEPAYREAVTAAALGEQGSAGVLKFADLGLHRLLFDTANADRVAEHVERWIGPLLRYDEDHHAQLVETLGCFLDGEGLRGVAGTLSIHPSTLKYRLGRIREILDLDLGDADVRFNVELAVRLRAGMRTIRLSERAE